MAIPLLGWIPPQDRTNDQNDAHAKALAKMPKFTLPFGTPPKGTKIILTDFWSKPDVVSVIGRPFTGFRQLTGSCVGVSIGNWLFTLAAVQSFLQQNPTIAFIPFWPYCYGRTRFNEGDRGQGEGAVDSVAGDTISKEGYFAITESGLPTFDERDGFALTSNQEYQWSDGASNLVTKWLSLGKQHVGTKAPLYSPDDIAAAIINGYPTINGDNNYAGNGSIVGSGDTAYSKTRYTGRGGHSTCFLGYWNHPNDGELFLYSNQWDGSTYPKDPAGGGRCTAWMPRSEVEKHFNNGGGDGGETMALSHLDWFPAQPKILDCFI